MLAVGFDAIWGGDDDDVGDVGAVGEEGDGAGEDGLAGDIEEEFVPPPQQHRSGCRSRRRGGRCRSRVRC